MKSYSPCKSGSRKRVPKESAKPVPLFCFALGIGDIRPGMSWQKLVFPFPSEESVHLAFRITALAQERDRQIGNPKGFAVFSGPEFSDDERTSTICYYFSPVAAANCADVLAPYSPVDCDKPDPEALGFSLAYGDLQGPSSWDLLK